MARFLICGTLAYDLIGRFDAPLRPDTRNVKLDRLDEGFGGCAMNIAYNLARLGHEPVPLVYVGDDFAPAYAAQVRREGISDSGIMSEPGTPCARGVILTGSDGAQFTAFFPGPSGLGRIAADLQALTAAQPFDAAIIAPDVPAKSIICAEHVAGMPLKVWCPGQYAEHVDARTLARLLPAVDMLVCNRHEWRMLRRHLPPRPIRGLPRLVVTNGAAAVLALPDRCRVPVPLVPPRERVDPTGCGDAFVAALTAAITQGRTLAEAIGAGIALAGRCLRRPGAQGH